MDASLPSWASEILDPQDEQGKRRLTLLQAAFDVVAQAGFEGLRTRAVADRAGVNIATLHYYFPSKQKLVEGLSLLMSAKFVTLHGPTPKPSGLPALDHLRQEFADAQLYLKEHSDLLLIQTEFFMRGQRDPEVRRVVEEMRSHWLESVEEILRDGMADHTFRSDLPLKDALAFLMATLSGTAWARPEQMNAIQRQAESWLLSPDAKRRLATKKGTKKKR
jgi:TetR/AcrR family transcriptional regulator, regulator of cefoperazone and chloramphenicol sensitivity